jgi:hypothetical protein
VAAREDEAEPVIGEPAFAAKSHLVFPSTAMDERAFELGELQLLAPRAANPVERAVAGRGRDPGPRIARNPVARPRLERRDEGIGERLLGEVEVTQDADQRSQDPPGFLAERPLDLLANGVGVQPATLPEPTSGMSMSRSGRTSIEPYAAPGHRAAASSAASRSGQSTM